MKTVIHEDIKEYNQCVDCLHNEVCGFKINREECVQQVRGKINNLGYMQDFFEFTFACKKFANKKSA